LGVTESYGAGGPLDKPEVTSYPIQSAADWGKLRPLSMNEGALDEQIEALERIGESLGGETYFLETIFSPLSIAADLVENPKVEIPRLMREEPQALRDGLEVITETFREFAKCCLDEGACGIFFATTDWASRNVLNAEQYAEWGRPYDLRVLEVAQGAPFNVLHVCKENNLLFALADYPTHAINWAVGSHGNPSLRDVQLNTDKTVIGGWTNETLRYKSHAMIRAEARAALEQTGGRRFMLGPACSIDPETPEENVKFARSAVDEIV
jgi:uroporphyrinogen decarboxylase